MAKRTAKKSRRKLPKAPLAEVIFELRWALQQPPNSPPVLASDPGLVPLVERFTERMKRIGFKSITDMSPVGQTGAYGIARRYFPPGQAHPIMQIGPGIFATNESVAYEWPKFKAQIKKGLKELLASYPKLDFFQIVPNHIELRYVDLFGKELFGKAAVFDFLQRGTRLQIALPDMLTDQSRFDGDADGRFVVQRRVKTLKNAVFTCDIASGRSKDADIVRLETKVIARNAGVPKFTTASKFISDVDKWLELAHSLTSDYFKAFVTDELMEKFRTI